MVEKSKHVTMMLAQLLYERLREEADEEATLRIEGERSASEKYFELKKSYDKLLKELANARVVRDNAQTEAACDRRERDRALEECNGMKLELEALKAQK